MSDNLVNGKHAEADEVRITSSLEPTQEPESGTPLAEANMAGDHERPLLKPEALIGFPGQIVETVIPYTEADPVAVLTNLLVGFGSVVGRAPYFIVEKSRHYPNLYAVIVGPSSKARKGQSWSTPKWLFLQADEPWVMGRIQCGLSSGEGVIFGVRDPLSAKDKGVTDKRLLVMEEEFAQPLKVMKRDGNTLSPVLRSAWDDGPLQILTRNKPIKATKAHVSIIGHITQDELLRDLSDTDVSNGFANRIIWIYAERSKIIPNPTGVPDEKLAPLAEKLKEIVKMARGVGQMTRDGQAEELWEKMYPALSEGKPGLAGAITSRAEAQVLRLSMIYALMDGTGVIGVQHLLAGVSYWQYADESVKMIFGERFGDRHVDTVAKFIRAGGLVPRNGIYHLFSRNVHRGEVERIINKLCSSGIAELKKIGGVEYLVQRKMH